jgi:4-oxalocrotonate tautomerase
MNGEDTADCSAEGDATVPHVIVELWPGNSDAQKQELSDAIVRSVTAILGHDDDAVSVGFEEVPSSEWTERVFEPDIIGAWPTLFKQPGYGRRP